MNHQFYFLQGKEYCLKMRQQKELVRMLYLIYPKEVNTIFGRMVAE